MGLKAAQISSLASASHLPRFRGGCSLEIQSLSEMPSALLAAGNSMTSSERPSLDPTSQKSGTKKRAQTQTFESGYFPVGWGSSTCRGGGQKARYVPRNQGNQTFWADFAGISRRCPKSSRERSLCSIFGPPKKKRRPRPY